MSSNGTFTSTNKSWRSAFLNSPGSPGSNFSYTSPVIPDGAYTLLVRGVDQNDLVTDPSERSVTVTSPAGNLAPIASFTSSCNQNVCTFDARSSTDENVATLTYSWTGARARLVGLRSGAGSHLHRGGDLHGHPDRSTSTG